MSRFSNNSIRLRSSASAVVAVAVLAVPQAAFAQSTGQQSAAAATAAQPDTGTANTGGQVGASQSTNAPQSATNEIVVTGSRIVRAPVTAQPATVLGSDQIEKEGYTNLGNALQELPAFSIPGNSPIGSQGSFSAGQTFVNLYNLGSQRTLSLVNGHRFVTTASSSIFGPVAGSPVDFSEIPTDLVDRTEVVSVGGAPIYGSDAIAGTVNVILKRDYDGAKITAQTGVSQAGDGQDYNVSALFGRNFSDGRGNITLNVNYDRQFGLRSSDRYVLSGDGPFFGTALRGQPFTHQLFTGGEHYNVFTNTGMAMFADSLPIYAGRPYASITNSGGQALYFNAGGQLVPFQNGQLTGSGLYQAGGDGFAIRDYGNFLVDSKRIQGTLLGHYDITDHIRFSGEAWLGRNIATNLSAQPYYNTALFANAGETNGNLILSTSNPFLSAADRATIINNLVANGSDPSSFYLARANTDLETGSFRSQTDLYRFVGTLEGDFALGTHKFSWEVSANYGQTDSQTTQRELVTQNYYNALNATTDANGNIVCAPGYTNAAIPTLSSTCAPLDIFGIGQESKAALNYVTAIAQTEQKNTQFDLVADINGSVLRLPAGDVKVSLGYEHRRESTNFNPGPFYAGQLNPDGTRTQFGNSIPIAAVSGAYHTDEGFGELDIPVISPKNDVPLVHSLNVQGAARYVRNSMTGGFWTYTGGGTYAPISAITFRGNYTRSFRAPAITEAFAPTGSVFDTAQDPCDNRYISGGPNPSRRAANCAAAGITEPFTSNVVDYTAEGTFGGNPHLKNEVANSWTAGAVVTPPFIRGFTLQGDYIAIDVKNEIASLGLTDLMDACYDAVNYPTNPFCGTFARNAAGQVTSFAEGNYNIGIEHFRALQIAFDYNFPLTRFGLPLSAGSVGISVNYLHTFSHYSKVGEGDIQYSVGTTQEPKDNVTANLNYNNGGFNFLWQTMYYGPTRIDVNDPATTYQYPNVHAFLMFNSSIGYDVGKRYSIRLIVNNVFNKGVPFPYSVSQTRYFDALLGRYYKVNVGVKF